MGSDGCLSVIKYFLFLFNLTFFLLGLLLLSLGLWTLFPETNFDMSTPFVSMSVLSYLLMTSGSITMSLGFFGCLGALKEVKCMLTTYFLLLTVLLTAQIVGGVLFFTQKTSFESTLEDHVLKLMRNVSSQQHFKQTMEYVQMETQCCGWDGPEDWAEIPCSCYHDNVTQHIQSPQMCGCPSNGTLCVIERGCKEIVIHWIDDHMLIILGGILAIAAVEICGMILSTFLYRWISVDYNLLY